MGSSGSVSSHRCINEVVEHSLERSWSIVAPAKINLRLKVLGRREDGYHLLSMLNTTCSSLTDELQVRLKSGGGISVVMDSPQLQAVPSEENLVAKVWRRYWEVFQLPVPPCGIDVKIAKRIPVGGGLGGGSSDAGALLRLLSAVFGPTIQASLNLDTASYAQRVISAALACGADVPYAFVGGVCWVTGIGEVIRPLAVGSIWNGPVLVVSPPKPVPTGPFYQFFRTQHPSMEICRDEPMERCSAQGISDALPALIGNDFEIDVCRLVPEVGEGLAIARSFFPRTSSLTGSGSCFFSLVPPSDEGLIAACIEALKERGMAVYVCHL
jgi:4-diphosphocytidyl-2-C-methyl-D-erythritol kinase